MIRRAKQRRVSPRRVWAILAVLVPAADSMGQTTIDASAAARGEPPVAVAAPYTPPENEPAGAGAHAPAAAGFPGRGENTPPSSVPMPIPYRPAPGAMRVQIPPPVPVAQPAGLTPATLGPPVQDAPGDAERARPAADALRPTSISSGQNGDVRGAVAPVAPIVRTVTKPMLAPEREDMAASPADPSGEAQAMPPVVSLPAPPTTADEPAAAAIADAATTPAAEQPVPPIPGPAQVPAAPEAGQQVDGTVDLLVRGVQQGSDSQVLRAECTSCGGYHAGAGYHAPGAAFGPTFCGPGGCIAGRPACPVPPEACTFVGAFFRNLYENLCCPDPCYQPSWVPAANAAFFADYARPQTLTRIRFDRGWAMSFPNINQYFTSKILKPYGPSSFSQLYMYQEIAASRGSFFIEVPVYRQVTPDFAPGNGAKAGFTDMNLGIKSLLFDSEMLQLTFQFRTYLPTGDPNNELGAGHVSLEPSLLAALKLSETTYLQYQLAQWIPIGGVSLVPSDPNLALQGAQGGVLSYLGSINHVLCYYTPTSMLIGTLEFDGWSFQNGGFFNPAGKGVGSGGMTFFNIGPGLRMSLCNKMDFGAAITFPVTEHSWGDPYLRVEVRFIY